MDNVFHEITKAFGALWNCRPRGNSLEIATPVPTSTEKYVTVFLTERNGKWIVSDGGMTQAGQYDCVLPSESQTYDRLLKFFIDDFDIKLTTNNNGDIFYYKTTTDRKFIPNIVFDLSNFIALVVNDALIDYNEKKERCQFSTSVKNFLLEKIPEEKLSFNSYISEEFRVKFGAVVDNGKGYCSLINFVTGASEDYMRRSIAQSNLYYDMLGDSRFSDLVKHKIVLLNDAATGYNSQKMAPYIKLCISKGQEPLNWSLNKNLLLDKITA